MSTPAPVISGAPSRPTTPVDGARSGGTRRLLHAGAFVLAWVAAALLLDVGMVGYLLLGVPLGVADHLLLRRRPLPELWARRPAGSRRARGGRAVSAAATAVLVLAYVEIYLRGEQWVDTLWIGAGAAVLCGLGYAILGRAFPAFALAAVLVATGSWAMAPRLSDQRTGDPELLRVLAATEGYRDLAVAVVDISAPEPVRFANTGSARTTRFEVGSLTKAMTGMVIADAVARGEVDMDAPVSAYLPLEGAAAGRATLAQLVSHTAGYPRDGASTDRRFLWALPLGLDPSTATLAQTLRDVRDVRLSGVGVPRYSNLGGATAGQAAAAAAGTTYPDLMRTRLFEPLHMDRTTVQTTPWVSGGRSASGRPVRPAVMTGLAPKGGVVSTTADMAQLAVAVLDGTAPGLAALDGTTPIGMGDSVGMFWGVTHLPGGDRLDQHSGSTEGYASYIAIDRDAGTAVIVLSDVSKGVDTLGADLLKTLS